MAKIYTIATESGEYKFKTKKSVPRRKLYEAFSKSFLRVHGYKPEYMEMLKESEEQPKEKEVKEPEVEEKDSTVEEFKQKLKDGEFTDAQLKAIKKAIDSCEDSECCDGDDPDCCGKDECDPEEEDCSDKQKKKNSKKTDPTSSSKSNSTSFKANTTPMF